ncbi:MAG: sulfur carrier protein ThiS [Nitrospirales bacterium]|nr:MAG: sulfur carrier protein ThiS [Nitrospirales bacterium]
MDIQVNGASRTLQDGLTVTDLLQLLDIRTEQVAVELNLKILDRADFPTSILNHGDTVEILSFIGGGAESPLHPHAYINTQDSIFDYD